MESMPHLVRWNEELGPFGLQIVGAHAQDVTEEKVKAKAQALGIPFPIITGGAVKDGLDFNTIPHCMLFDHTGKCIYRGSPLESGVEEKIKGAVGKMLAESVDNPGKQVAALTDLLKKGQPPLKVLPNAIPLLKSSDSKTAEEAKALVAKLTEGTQKRVDEAEALMGDDPVAAYGKLEKVPTALKGTPAGNKAFELLAELKKDKVVQAELKAKPTLNSLRQLDTVLSNQASGAGVDVKDSSFQKLNPNAINQMKTYLQKLRKDFPETKAAEEANLVGDKYGIVLK